MPDRVQTAGLPFRLASELDFLAGRVERWAQESCTSPSVRARAYAAQGKPTRAVELLNGIDPTPLGPGDLMAAAWATSRAGPVTLAAPLRAAVAELDEFVVAEGVPLGPRAVADGMLLATAGELSEAVARLRTAVAVGDRRAPFWGALARLELGRVLLGTLDDEAATAEARTRDEEARQVLHSAHMFFRAAGHVALKARAEDLLGGRDGPVVGAHPGRGFLVHGHVWLVGFGLQPPTQVRGGLGLCALAHLVDSAHSPVTAVELDAVLDGRRPPAVVVAASRHERFAEHRSGTVLDDAGSIVRDDRSRSRVSKLVHRTIDALARSHRPLAEHLAATISTGYVCRYSPQRPVRWQLRPLD